MQKVECPRIVMIGPSIDGLGGISRVVAMWEAHGVFGSYGITYIPTSSDTVRFKLFYTLKFFLIYFVRLFHGNPVVYIHTASHRSFYRKALFILPALLLKRKVVCHIHPDLFVDFICELKGVTACFVRFMLKHVSGFVVLSSRMQDKIKVLFPEKPVWVLHNPVDVESMKNVNGCSRESNRLLFLGWFISSKGVYELVDAVGKLLEESCDIRLDFFGTKDADRLRNYITSKELGQSITVHGWIGHDEKVKEFYRSTMLVLPSHTEGVPNVILEAMATKTPIVATPVGGLQEVLCDGINSLIVRVNDFDDLSEKIRSLIDNPEKRVQLAENAYREAVEKYDIQVIKRDVGKIIEEACFGHKKG